MVALNVLVAGAGINGLMSAFLLTRAGVRVTVCDAADIPNTGNASHGSHRLIHPWRQAKRHDAHAQASCALALWHEIMATLACRGFEKTGILVANDADCEAEHPPLDPSYCGKALPGSHRFPFRRVFTEFGVLMAREIQTALIDWLSLNGARFMPRTPLVAVDPVDGLATLSGHGERAYDRIVIAAGPGLQPFAQRFGLSIVRPWRCYVVYAPEDEAVQPSTAWADLAGRDLWGMPPVRNLPAKFGWGALSHAADRPTYCDDYIRAAMSEAYAQIDLSFGYLRRGRVASKIWTEIGSGRRVLRQGRCIAITSDNGGGFKFAPLAAKEACHLVLAE